MVVTTGHKDDKVREMVRGTLSKTGVTTRSRLGDDMELMGGSMFVLTPLVVHNFRRLLGLWWYGVILDTTALTVWETTLLWGLWLPTGPEGGWSGFLVVGGSTCEWLAPIMTSSYDREERWSVRIIDLFTLLWRWFCVGWFEI